MQRARRGNTIDASQGNVRAIALDADQTSRGGPMRVEKLEDAVRLAKRFAELSKFVRIAKVSDGHRYLASCPKESGMLRRASMDLTRALAEMRKP